MKNLRAIEVALGNRQGRSRHIPDRRSGNISRNQGRLPRSLNKRARGRIKAVVVIRARDRRNNVIVPVFVRIFPRFENSRNVEMTKFNRAERLLTGPG
jgi:hypothetical protein